MVTDWPQCRHAQYARMRKSRLNLAPPTAQPQSSTARERVRRYRARKRDGQVPVTIVVNPAFIADLVRLGWLSAHKREDRGAVSAAFLAFTQSAWDISRREPRLFKAHLDAV